MKMAANLMREQGTLLFMIIIIYVVLLMCFVIEIILSEESHSSPDTSTGHIKPCSPAYNKNDHQIIRQGGEYGSVVNQTDSPKKFVLVRKNRRSFMKEITDRRHEEAPSPVEGTVKQLPGVGNTQAQDGVWQSVGGTRFKFFVFSAYYDARQNPTVRVIGATKTIDPEKVWCRLWYHNATHPDIINFSISVTGSVKMMRENWLLKYSACFVLCLLERNQSAPSSVSIVRKQNQIPINRMIVHHNTTVQPPKKMAACVKPLHYDYNKSLSMMEFIELNRLLGIEHIYFYNNSVSPSTSCVLDAYAAKGRVTVLPWQLKMISQKQIRTEGMFAAFNDCLYRSMYSYSHVAFIDLDEFIMPKHNETLFQLINWLNKQTIRRGVASYTFQNAFFYLQWSDDASQTVYNPLQSKLVTLRKTRRRKKLHPHNKRSKYICRPEYVLEAGNHFVWKFIPGHGPLNVRSDAAILNHYRVCEFGGDKCIRSASVVDRTAFRYRNRLIRNVHQQWNSVKSDCNLPEIMTLGMTDFDITHKKNITTSKPTDSIWLTVQNDKHSGNIFNPTNTH